MNNKWTPGGHKTALPPGGHVFPLITTIFKLAKIVTSREKDPPGGHVFLPIQTIFELNCRIQETNFHEDWAKNKTAPPPGGQEKDPPPGGHVFLPIRTIFELNRHIQKTQVLTKFYEDWTKNVTSSNAAPPPGGHVFSPIWTIFELVRDINETNVLNKFHYDWASIVISRVFTKNTAPPHGDHVFQWTGTIFELNQHIILGIKCDFYSINWKNVLTKFHEDRIINVASRVFTRQNVDDGRRTTDKRRSQKVTMSTLCSATVTIFELVQDIIDKNHLTKFHEDRTINVTSRVLTRQMLTPHAARRTKGDHKSSPLCSG
ncbi:hypothetical protein DPMN_117740 [Dreissena polymorpha]|uniref:Uncharacterized protein n=1 Tax=Dreissena polymorpha TaxID=45954 RepID=A0A9D4GLU8_DREPO|nr:hypothetical protein DPMN_117740 [Dreissena polymorpha]